MIRGRILASVNLPCGDAFSTGVDISLSFLLPILLFSGSIREVCKCSMARAAAVVDEDRADLEVLNSNLRKTGEITSQMAKLLGGFDERLERMEQSMRPIHRTTQRLKFMNLSMFRSLFSP